MILSTHENREVICFGVDDCYSANDASYRRSLSRRQRLVEGRGVVSNLQNTEAERSTNKAFL